MQISEFFRALRRRWYATVAIVIVAVAAAVMLDKSMATAPTGSATVQVLVDSPVSSLVNLQSNPTGLEARASVLAQAISSNAVLAAVAKVAGVPAAEVTAQGPYSGPGEALDVPTPSEARSMQLVSVAPKYRLTVVAQLNLPIVTVQVQGPNPVAAGHLADAVVPGTEAWLSSLATPDQVKTGHIVHLRQLGDAQAGTVNSSSAKMVAGVGAVAILILGFLAIGLTDRERRERRRLEREQTERELAAQLDGTRDGSVADKYAGNGRAVNGHVANGFAPEPGHARGAAGESDATPYATGDLDAMWDYPARPGADSVAPFGGDGSEPAEPVGAGHAPSDSKHDTAAVRTRWPKIGAARRERESG